jgi:toxin ParE1/3/4
MKRVVVTGPARRDRTDLWLYIAEDNLDAADRLIEEIDQKLLLLADTPSLGRAHPDIAPNMRYFPIGHYLIFYTPQPDGIKVIRILHAARSIAELL